MTEESYVDIIAKLRLKREQLQLRVDSIKIDVTQEHSHDWAEQAIERENDEVMDVIGTEAQATINDIDAALSRIAQGSYGICSDCGENIDGVRLSIIPEAIRCITCTP
jgi:RNA polymerase-binding transcription factor DksA